MGGTMTRVVHRVLAVTAAFQLIAGAVFAEGDLSRDTRVRIGFKIAASQHIELDADVPSQGLGSFLVTVSSCNDCHTQPNFAPGGDPDQRQPEQVNLDNYLAGGRSFPTPTGTFCSRNLTPAPDTGLPAGLTRDQFFHVIRTGCDPQDENFNDPSTCGLLNVMPWPNFRNYRPFEISAIYDYLSALPHTNVGSAAQCTPDPQGVADKQ
jgi:hypothetical protein